MTKVAILGYGVVGSGVGDMLTKNAGIIAAAAGREVKLAYVVELRDVAVPAGATLTKRFEDVLDDPDVRIVVETIGGARAAADLTRRALMSGRHVVTSNKELVAGYGDELIRLARQHGVMYLFEASVGGGIPILRPIAQCLAGNRLTGIDGIVNGSTNYLL
ncbi:MAG: homoserine dehydrogenase, partial [Clostridiales bacterium]|nr:homoserine dehydrogenase [Clostridiales bacterium]